MKLRKWAELLAGLTPGIVAILIAVQGWAESFGPGPADPSRDLSAAALAACGAIYFFVYLRGEREDKREIEMAQRIDALRDAVKNVVSPDNLERVRAQVDLLPEWGKVLSTYASNYMLTRLNSILTEQKFAVQGGFFFRDFYIDVFKTMPKCKLIATAEATTSYMWDNLKLNEIFAEFIRVRGGDLTRIFFLDDASQLNDPMVRAILLGQHQADVKVYWVLRDSLRSKGALHMLAEENGAFGWKLRVNNGQIEDVEVSWAPGYGQDCMSYLNSVLHHPATQRFEPY